MRVAAVLMAAIASVAVAGVARASDLYSVPPVQTGAPFSFEGFYVGAQGGLVTGPYRSGELGVVAGMNFDLSSPVLAGIEFQSDWLPGASSGSTFDFFALGRLGVVAMDGLMLYGEGGAGWIGGRGSYAFGGGAEYALTDQVGLKGEILGTGPWGGAPDTAKIQAGLIFHLP